MDFYLFNLSLSYLFELSNLYSFFFFFFFQLFVAPGDVPTPSWGFLLYIFYLQYYTAISPFLWFIAMRTRSGTGCFLSYLTRWREIETAILASYPSAAEALVLVLIGSGIPLGEPTVMMVPLRSIHYVQ